MVDVQSIDNRQVVGIHIVSADAVVYTQNRLAIIIMHQYAYIGHGKTIHSSGQMETFGNSVNEKSMKVPGRKQSITTQYGFCIPLNIKSGLPYMTLRPYTDDEWDNLPHVILTSDLDWDPTILDNIIDDNNTWFDSVSNLQDDSVSNLFDLHGNYRHRHVVHNICIDDPTLQFGVLPNSVPLCHSSLFQDANDIPDTTPNCTLNVDVYRLNAREISSREPDYKSFIPNFAWCSVDIIKKTFAATTQYARMPMSTHLTKHFKSPFPALNVQRRQKSVAIDTVYVDVPTIDSGFTQAQIYCGMESHVCDVYGMKTDKQFINTFDDVIRQRDTMDILISDIAQVETQRRAKDILRAYVIGN